MKKLKEKKVRYVNIYNFLYKIHNWKFAILKFFFLEEIFGFYFSYVFKYKWKGFIHRFYFKRKKKKLL